MKKLHCFLLLAVFGLSSCIDNDDTIPVYVFYDEPAIYVPINEKPVFKTSQGWLFYAPSIDTVAVKTGALLWTQFTIKKSEENYIHIADDISCYTAEGLTYDIVDKQKVIIPENMQYFYALQNDDYRENIKKAQLSIHGVDNFLFFGFNQEDSVSSHTYELFLNPEETHVNGYPVLYIRSKKIDEPENRFFNTNPDMIFAFDMTDYIEYFREKMPESDAIYFNIKYKIENDKENDVYKEFDNNPLPWHIK
jgi:hypothetical protein